MDEIIRTENLTKHFGKVQAVKNLSIKIKKGEIYGFLGLNGAGKTTTIRMLLGLIQPTSGFSLLKGEKVKPGNTDMWSKIGYMVEVPYAYPELTVRDNLEIIRRLRFLSDKKSVDKVMEKLQLTQYSYRKVKHLSQGNAQRLGLAKALIHHPEILLLDEPANSLDPAGIVEIRELLLDMAGNMGITIFISSHILGEISKFANRIGIIHEGLLVQELDSVQLDQLCQKKLLLKTINNEKAIQFLKKSKYAVDATDHGILEIKDENTIAHPDEIATKLVKAGLPPTLLKVETEDLESYFLRTIGMKGDLQ